MISWPFISNIVESSGVIPRFSAKLGGHSLLDIKYNLSVLSKDRQCSRPEHGSALKKASPILESVHIIFEKIDINK